MSISEGLKKETIAYYNEMAKRYQDERNQDYETFIEKYLSNELNFFITSLKGRKILDIGAGPGRDALLLKEKGLHPICIDLSKKMVALCEQKGLEAYQKDMEHLDFEENSFDGAWAYASLVHLTKTKIPFVIGKISGLLRKNGIFFLGMLGGDKEILYKNKESTKLRFFSLYKKKELEKILEKNFKILMFKKITINKDQIYLNYILQKN